MPLGLFYYHGLQLHECDALTLAEAAPFEALPLCLFLPTFSIHLCICTFLCEVNQETSVLKLINSYVVNFKLHLSYSLIHFAGQFLAVVQVGSARTI